MSIREVKAGNAAKAPRAAKTANFLLFVGVWTLFSGRIELNPGACPAVGEAMFGVLQGHLAGEIQSLSRSSGAQRFSREAWLGCTKRRKASVSQLFCEAAASQSKMLLAEATSRGCERLCRLPVLTTLILRVSGAVI